MDLAQVIEEGDEGRVVVRHDDEVDAREIGAGLEEAEGVTHRVAVLAAVGYKYLNMGHKK